jgi:predicted permease
MTTDAARLNIAEDWFSTAQYFDIKNGSHGFDALAIAIGSNVNLTGDGEPERVGAIRVSSNLLPMLGASAARGRLFVPDEDTPGRPATAVLAYGTWMRRYGGNPAAVGQTLTLNGQRYEIVGVLPESFSLPREVLPTLGVAEDGEIFLPLPLAPTAAGIRTREDYNIIGTLKRGVSLAAAQAELDTITARLRREFPDVYPPNGGLTFSIVPLLEQVVGNVRRPLWILVGSVGCVLLIACANVANLLLARAQGRSREVAVRAALGAGRMQLVRQVLAESFVLSGIGGALGLLVAWAGIRLVHGLPEGSLPRMEEVRLDAGVLLFALVISVGVALIFGLIPAIQASRAGLRDTMNAFSGATRHSGGRLLSALVIIEVALALMLLVGAGLMTRSFAQLMRVSPGFEPGNLLAVQLYLPQSKYKTGIDRTRFYMDTIHRVGAIPGVYSAAGVSALPMYPVGIDFALPFTIEGRAAPANGEEPRADIRTATPGYFETMKIALRKGRFIDSRDRQGAPGTIVINETMARRYFAGEDPIGKVVRNPHGKGEVVGVVGDVKHYGLDSEPRAELFMPAWQQPLNGMALIVRTASDPKGFVEAIRREVLAVDAEQPIYDVSAMVDVVSRSVFLPRISMLLLGAFALTALLLAVVGIYGVVSYSVTQRTRELGVRMALGAAAGDTLRLVLGRSLRLVAAGTVCGLVASFAVTRVMAGLLYDVSPLDPVVFGGVSVLLAAAGLIASLVPARRATRVDPIEALRIQ